MSAVANLVPRGKALGTRLRCGCYLMIRHYVQIFQLFIFSSSFHIAFFIQTAVEVYVWMCPSKYFWWQPKNQATCWCWIKTWCSFIWGKSVTQTVSSTHSDKLKTYNPEQQVHFAILQAYLFSPINRIVGVEISEELCKLQQEMVNKFTMSDRIQVSSFDGSSISYSASTVRIHQSSPQPHDLAASNHQYYYS